MTLNSWSLCSSISKVLGLQTCATILDYVMLGNGTCAIWSIASDPAQWLLRICCLALHQSPLRTWDEHRLSGHIPNPQSPGVSQHESSIWALAGSLIVVCIHCYFSLGLINTDHSSPGTPYLHAVRLLSRCPCKIAYYPAFLLFSFSSHAYCWLNQISLWPSALSEFRNSRMELKR